MQYSVKYVISSDFQSEASRNYQEIWMKNSTQFLVKKKQFSIRWPFHDNHFPQQIV